MQNEEGQIKVETINNFNLVSDDSLTNTGDVNVIFYIVVLIASLFILARYIRIGKEK